MSPPARAEPPPGPLTRYQERTQTLSQASVGVMESAPGTAWRVVPGRSPPHIELASDSHCRARPVEGVFPTVAPLTSAGAALEIGRLLVDLDVRCDSAHLALVAIENQSFGLEVAGATLVVRFQAKGAEKADVLTSGLESARQDDPRGSSAYENVLRVVTMTPLDAHEQPRRFTLGDGRNVHLRTPVLQVRGDIQLPPFIGAVSVGELTYTDATSPHDLRGSFLASGTRSEAGVPAVRLLGTGEIVDDRGAFAPAAAPAWVVLAVAAGTVGILVVAAVLFTRVTRSAALEHPTRRALADLAHHDPGIALHEACQVLGLARGSALHHLAILERSGLVIVRRERRRVVLFGPGKTNDAQRLLLLRKPLVQQVLRALLEHPEATQSQIATMVRRSQAHVSGLVQRLQSAGIIRRKRAPARGYTLTAAFP